MASIDELGLRLLLFKKKLYYFNGPILLIVSTSKIKSKIIETRSKV